MLKTVLHLGLGAGSVARLDNGGILNALLLLQVHLVQPGTGCSSLLAVGERLSPNVLLWGIHADCHCFAKRQERY